MKDIDGAISITAEVPARHIWRIVRRFWPQIRGQLLPAFRPWAASVVAALGTCLYVDDLEAAETFYSRVLGLEPFSRVEGRHVFFRCGPGVFLLFNPSKTRQPGGDVPTHGAQGPGHVAFAVRMADLPAWREHLRRHGVAIEKEVAWPGGGYSIYFRDPAGNSVELAIPQTWGLN